MLHNRRATFVATIIDCEAFCTVCKQNMRFGRRSFTSWRQGEEKISVYEKEHGKCRMERLKTSSGIFQKRNRGGTRFQCAHAVRFALVYYSWNSTFPAIPLFGIALPGGEIQKSNLIQILRAIDIQECTICH